MCGIAGILSFTSDTIKQEALGAMAAVLSHRGPDGNATWQNKDNSVGFAHTRLAIIDRSEAAAQPMQYGSRYTIVFNGEIYNYKELRTQLLSLGLHFSTRSDTEVLAAAYAHFGADCLQHLDGMFAFAIWDAEKEELFCARDRFGEKPFYFYKDEDVFCFASEMKALWAIGIERTAEPGMLMHYLALGQVQNPNDKSATFFKNIYSLAPAKTLLVRPGKRLVQDNLYYNISKAKEVSTSESQSAAVLSSLLADSVKKRMISDVPLGYSLSGGLDSSSIAYYLQKASIEEGEEVLPTAFSATFPGFENDEEKHIKLLEEKMDLDVVRTTATADDLLSQIEKVFYHQEEPFPSSSIFAQYKVYEAARNAGIPVLLDGQGADEILGGYHRYIHWYIQEHLAKFRFSKASRMYKEFKANEALVSMGIKNAVAPLFPALAAMRLERKAYNAVLNNEDIHAALRRKAGSGWDFIHKPIIHNLNTMLHYNTMHTGLEEMLRYADRNSMAHGVEVRLPFLQQGLVQYALSLPSSYKMQDGYTKHILRKSMEHKLPDAIVWRKDKVGFETPQKTWMQHKDVQAQIQEAKALLVKEEVLSAKVLKKPVIPKSAHAADNNDWRYLCAAYLFKK